MKKLSFLAMLTLSIVACSQTTTAENTVQAEVQQYTAKAEQGEANAQAHLANIYFTAKMA